MLNQSHLLPWQQQELGIVQLYLKHFATLIERNVLNCFDSLVIRQQSRDLKHFTVGNPNYMNTIHFNLLNFVLFFKISFNLFTMRSPKPTSLGNTSIGYLSLISLNGDTLNQATKILRQNEKNRKFSRKKLSHKKKKLSLQKQAMTFGNCEFESRVVCIDGSRAVDRISPKCIFPQISKCDSLTKLLSFYLQDLFYSLIGTFDEVNTL